MYRTCSYGQEKHQLSHGTETCADQESDRKGVRTPSLENPKAIGFLSNTGPDSLETDEATKTACNVVGSSSTI